MLRASVTVDDDTVGSIGPGLLVLVGVRQGDTDEAAAYIADKIANLRILDDANGRMDLSLLDTGGHALVVSQFTLHGDARKGRRPSYTDAARGEAAEGLYDEVCTRLRKTGVPVQTGCFGAEMMVEMVGDGPVTVLLDSDRLF